MSMHEHAHGSLPGMAGGHQYAPFEIGVCGIPGAMDSPAVSALLGKLASTYRVGIVRRALRSAAASSSDGAHQAASGPVLTRGEESFSYSGAGEIDRVLVPALWQEADVVVAEAGAQEPIAKIVLLDPSASLLDEIESGGARNILAFILPAGLPDGLRERCRRIAAQPATGPAGSSKPALIEAHETDRIARLVLSHLTVRAASTPLYGLVLSGGASSRMKRDKAAIPYHGLPQVRYAYALLERVCERVFVSLRSERSGEVLFSGLDQLPDRFLGIGPVGGILTAMHEHPGAAWLVLGCDLPYVGEETLRLLAAERDPVKLATCYLSSHDALPEPMCAIYEPAIRPRILQFLGQGRDCPRKTLINSRTKRIALRRPHELDNVNTPEESERALTELSRGAAVSGGGGSGA
jgi:molybdopterin-guanine dinucleotide biosynthesis protein A